MTEATYTYERSTCLIEFPEPEPTIEEMIAETFPGKEQLMTRIAHCESGVKQFREDGTPVQGPTKDFGVFQVHEPTWNKVAIELGLDYKNSVEDNIKMARHIYDVQGLSAWNPSKHCWR